MTQKELDSLVEMWVMCNQTSTNGFELVVNQSMTYPDLFCIGIEHKSIDSIILPYDKVNSISDTPKDITKKVFELLQQIYENGDEWLQDEIDHEADKAAERWDNDRKSDLEN